MVTDSEFNQLLLYSKELERAMLKHKAKSTELENQVRLVEDERDDALAHLNEMKKQNAELTFRLNSLEK